MDSNGYFLAQFSIIPHLWHALHFEGDRAPDVGALDLFPVYMYLRVL